MRAQTILLTLTVLGSWAPRGTADEPVLPLRVMYVGKAGTVRAADY
jgi:hypothetical protein